MSMEILISVLIFAALTDILYFRIPNIFIVTGMTAGLICKYLQGGTSALTVTVLQIMVLFLLLFPFYMIGGIGAGDVKLLMMVGCYMEKTTYYHSIVVTMLLAGMVSVVKMICVPQCRQRLYYLFGYMRKVVLTGAIDTYEINRKNEKEVIRLSVPTLCSVLLLYGGYYT